MKDFLLRKTLQVIPVLLIISFIVFIMIYVAGDPTDILLPLDASAEDRDALRTALGLDRPFVEQYAIFLKNMAHGNFGRSIRHMEPSLPLVMDRLPATLELAAFAMGLAVLLGVPFGILSARLRNSFGDLLLSGISVLGRAMPNFWLGIMLILYLAVELRIFPVSGRGGFAHIVMPGFSLAFGLAAQIMPLVRSSMLEIASQDFIRTARGKGLSEYRIVWKHALRNALIPVIAIMTVQIPNLIGGALITETVFAWPGLGQLVIQSIYNLDMAVVQAAVFVIAVITLFFSFLADFIFCLIDPRIQTKSEI